VNEDQVKQQQCFLNAFLTGRENPAKVRTLLQREMWLGAGIFRNATDLNSTLESINNLSHADIRSESARNLTECCIVRNMCMTASLICRSALIRKESRGAHVRTDVKQIHDAQHSPFGHTYISLCHEGIEQNRGAI
jgi:fumarate reductase (CoM/CoB) subunit A